MLRVVCANVPCFMLSIVAIVIVVVLLNETCPVINIIPVRNVRDVTQCYVLTNVFLVHIIAVPFVMIVNM